MNEPVITITTLDERVAQSKAELSLVDLHPKADAIMAKDVPDHTVYMLQLVLKGAQKLEQPTSDDVEGVEKIETYHKLAKKLSGRLNTWKKGANEEPYAYIDRINAIHDELMGYVDQVKGIVKPMLEKVKSDRQAFLDHEKQVLEERYKKRYTYLTEKLGMTFNGITQCFTLYEAQIHADVVREASTDMIKELVATQVQPIVDRIKHEKERAAQAGTAYGPINEKRAQFLIERCGAEAVSNDSGGVTLVKGSLSTPKKSLYLFSDEKFGELCADFAEEGTVDADIAAEAALATTQIRGVEQTHAAEAIAIDHSPEETDGAHDRRVILDLYNKLEGIRNTPMRTAIGTHAITDKKFQDQVQYLQNWLKGALRDIN